MPTVDAILTAAGGTRSQAYELAQRIRQLLPDVARPVGRPAADPAETPPDVIAQVREEVLRFVLAHPGCAHTGQQRARYSDAFRRFLVELRERHAALSLAAFATATTVPEGTLEDWLRGPDLAVGHGDPVAPRGFAGDDGDHPEVAGHGAPGGIQGCSRPDRGRTPNTASPAARSLVRRR